MDDDPTLPEPATDDEDLDPYTALHTIVEALTDREADAVWAVLRAWIAAQRPPAGAREDAARGR